MKTMSLLKNVTLRMNSNVTLLEIDKNVNKFPKKNADRWLKTLVK